MTYNNQKLLELAERLLPDNGPFLDELRQAIEQPAKYVARFSDELGERGVTKPFPELPWFALVEGLRSRAYLWEIDWKQEPDEVIQAVDCLVLTRQGFPLADRWDWAKDWPYGRNNGFLATVAQHFPEWQWVAQTDWWAFLTEGFLKAITNHLSEQGLVLAWLDIDSDSYALIVVHASEIKKLQELATQTGYGQIDRF